MYTCAARPDIGMRCVWGMGIAQRASGNSLEFVLHTEHDETHHNRIIVHIYTYTYASQVPRACAYKILQHIIDNACTSSSCAYVYQQHHVQVLCTAASFSVFLACLYTNAAKCIKILRIETTRRGMASMW